MTDPGPRSLGIGHLAAAGFPQLWNREGDGAVAHLRRYAAFDGSRAVATYTFDARCLLATDLTDEQLELLWCSCTRGNHRPSRDGLTGRAWMRIVQDVMAGHADPDALARLADAGHHPELAGRVLRAVEQFHAVSLSEVPDDAARAALAGVVHAGYPDLALRLLLAMVPAHLMPLSAALFDELTDLSDRIDLDPYVVTGLEFLVRRD